MFFYIKAIYLRVHFLRFEEGAEQFRLDVAQNPNDTEESIWCFLCEAKLYGVDEPRRRFLEVNKRLRKIISTWLSLKWMFPWDWKNRFTVAWHMNWLAAFKALTATSFATPNLNMPKCSASPEHITMSHIFTELFVLPT